MLILNKSLNESKRLSSLESESGLVYFYTLYPVLPRMLLGRCLDSRSDFLETTWGEMVVSGIDLIWFRLRAEMFSALSVVCLFGRAFDCFVLVWLFIIWLFIRFSGVKLSKLLTATATSTKKVCVITLYSSLCRCLQKVTKQHREIPTFCIFERTWTIRQ